jgi:hypothetical protein
MMALSGDSGARKLIDEHADLVAEIEMDNDSVLIDIDTPEALAELREAGQTKRAAPAGLDHSANHAELVCERSRCGSIGGEIGGLELERLQIAVAGQRARHDDVVFDLDQIEAEDAARALELRVEVRVDHPLLARQAARSPRPRFDPSISSLLTIDQSLSPAQPAAAGFRVIIGDADLVDVLAEPDIGRPFAGLDAARDVNGRHRSAPISAAAADRDGDEAEDRLIVTRMRIWLSCAAAAGIVVRRDRGAETLPRREIKMQKDQHHNDAESPASG